MKPEVDRRSSSTSVKVTTKKPPSPEILLVDEVL
jgi:hypothetical protein